MLQLDFDVNVKTNLFSFYGTYGITDRWDISMLVPILQVQFDVDSTASILNRTKELGRAAKHSVTVLILEKRLATLFPALLQALEIFF